MATLQRGDWEGNQSTVDRHSWLCCSAPPVASEEAWLARRVRVRAWHLHNGSQGFSISGSLQRQSEPFGGAAWAQGSAASLEAGGVLPFAPRLVAQKAFPQTGFLPSLPFEWAGFSISSSFSSLAAALGKRRANTSCR